MTTSVFSQVRPYVERITALGWSLLSTLLALILAAIALTQPIWALELSDGLGGLTRRAYSWSWVVEEDYMNGVWHTTTIRSYTGPTFTQFRVPEAIGTAYLVGVSFVVLLLVLVILEFLARARKVPVNAVPITNIVAMGLGFVTLGLPALSIPAAAGDVGVIVSGFFGSAAAGGIAYTWGAGLSWWIWLVATIIALVVFVVPLVQSRPARPVLPR